MKNLTNRMFLPSPRWAVVGQWISGIALVISLLALLCVAGGIYEPANLVKIFLHPITVAGWLVLFITFHMAVDEAHQANLERLNGTFGQKPRTDGKIDLCCPECFSKDYKKVNNHYECQCGATW